MEVMRSFDDFFNVRLMLNKQPVGGDLRRHAWSSHDYNECNDATIILSFRQPIEDMVINFKM